MVRTVDIDLAAYADLVLGRKYTMVDTKSGKILFDIDITNDEWEIYKESQFRLFKLKIDDIKKTITNKKRERDENF
jgi:hypothetical protein